MATKIVTKNSSTAGAAPTATDLVQGELAVNVADKRLYTEDNAGAIVELGTNPSTLTVTGEITANGGIALGDNDKATFGASDDLQIYHSGTGSYIDDAATGHLYIRTQGDGIYFQSIAGEQIAHFNVNGSNKFYYDNAEKLATTSTGIDVTGSVVADGLTVNSGTANVVATFTSTDAYSLIKFEDNDTTTETTLGALDNDMVFRVGASERLRIDGSSGSLLVGKTAPTIATTGVELRPSGQLFATQSGNYPLLLNRTVSNGDIIQLRKNGTTVGSIGVGNSNDLYIGNEDTGLCFFDNERISPWNPATNSLRDSALDLGDSNARFKELYLSGKSNTGSITTDNANTQFNKISRTGAVALYVQQGDNTNDIAQFRSGNGQAGTGTQQVTIQASGNVMVGTTTTNIATEGTVLYGGGNKGVMQLSSTAKPALYVNRSTDGELAQFRRGGTTVGSIGTKAGDLTIGDADVGLRFDTGAGLIPWNMTTNAATDGAIDIGAASARFKDLYLSGEVIAGAGANNNPSITSHVDTDTGLFFGGGNILGFSTGGSERARINAAGNLLVGGTVSGAGAQSGICIDGGETDSNIFIRHANGTGSGSLYMAFTYNTSVIGAITQNGTSQVLFNISSDQRLKENIADADDAGSKIDSIQVRKYDWKADGSHQDYGMIAQELQLVAPEAVSAPEDPEEMMGVDYSKLVPLMLKEIQSLRNRVAQLEG